MLALLAGFALFQWRSAASAAEERKEIVARVGAFGDVMATYSFDDVESANKKAMGYLTGDALEERKKVDLAALRDQLQSQKTKLKSTTYAVYVGSVDGNLASAVLAAVLQAAEDDPAKLLAGSTLEGTVREVLNSVAAHARDVVSGQTLDNFIAALATVLSDGLTRAEKELGRNLDLPALPAILNQLVAVWLRGGGTPLNLASAAFDPLFARSTTHP